MLSGHIGQNRSCFSNCYLTLHLLNISFVIQWVAKFSTCYDFMGIDDRLVNEFPSFLAILVQISILGYDFMAL